jgi:tetratricopeptide (TPR) repeat protein
MKKKLEDHLKSLLKDKGEELEKTLGCLIDGDVSLGNLNEIWKKRVKQKDCGKEEYLAVERIIEKFIEREKKFGEAYHKLGNIYYRRKFYEEAKRKYREALDIEEWFLCSIDANPFESLLKQDSSLLPTIPKDLKDKFETKCVPISETATVRRKDDGLVITDGEKIYNLKKDKKEDEWINIYREDTQDKAWCYHDLGYLLYQTWDYDEAVKNYNEAIKIAEKAKDEKSIAWFCIDLGTALMKLERFEDAEKAFNKALVLIEKDKGKDKDKAYVYNALGRLYYRKELYNTARKKLELAKGCNPDLDEVYNNLGLLDFKEGLYENAKKYFQKAIEMDKREKKFLFRLAEKDARKFLFDLKQKIEFPKDGRVPVKSELRKEFVYKCERLLSYNAELFTNKKCRKIVDREDRYWIEKNDNSLEVYKDLLKDGPIEPELKKKLEEKGLPLPVDSTINKENGKWVITDKEKKEIYCIVRKEDGKLNIYAKKKCENHAEAHLNLGDVFFKEGKIKDAGKEYEEAIRIDRNSAEAYYNLGNLAAKNKEKERAEKLYGEALRINPDYTKARTALEALDLPKEAGVDWWDWWFSGSGQQSGSKKAKKIHWWTKLSCLICGQEPRQEIPRQKIPWRKLVGGALIFILFLFVIGLPIAFIAGTFMPPNTVSYENNTVYQRTSIENLFDIDAKFEKDLNNSINSNISANLTKIFKTKGFSISENE